MILMKCIKKTLLFVFLLQYFFVHAANFFTFYKKSIIMTFFPKTKNQITFKMKVDFLSAHGFHAFSI